MFFLCFSHGQNQGWWGRHLGITSIFGRVSMAWARQFSIGFLIPLSSCLMNMMRIEHLAQLAYMIYRSLSGSFLSQMSICQSTHRICDWLQCNYHFKTTCQIFLFWLYVRFGVRMAIRPYHPLPSRQESHLLLHLALLCSHLHFTPNQECQTVFICTKLRRRVERSVSKTSVGPLYSYRPVKENTLLTGVQGLSL